jgi:hypothetical protein
MRLPQDRLIFLVDLVPVGAFPGLGMIDFYPLEAMDPSRKSSPWTGDGCPGHPVPATGSHARRTSRTTSNCSSTPPIWSRNRRATAAAGSRRKNELQFDKYKDMPGYANGRAMVVRRYCCSGDAAPSRV